MSSACIREQHTHTRRHMLHTDYLLVRLRLRLAVLEAAEVAQEREQKELVD